VEKKGEMFRLDTSRKTYVSRFVIWAAGEYQYPREISFPGAEHCIHNSRVNSWGDLSGEERVVIGGYESGIDAGIQLVRAGKRVTVLSRDTPWLSEEPDPSRSLSPYTRERLAEVLETGRMQLRGEAEVVRVTREANRYYIHLATGERVEASEQPILATGFRSGLCLIRNHFHWDEEGNPVLTDRDESEKTPGLFLAGPRVKHGDVIFCFIYKFRQRFAVIVDEIIRRLGVAVDPDVFQY